MSLATQDIFSLKGNVALVTGASGVLGSQFARALSRAGAKVVLAARRIENMTGLAQSIRDEGGIASVVRLDVVEKSSIEKCFDLCESEMQGPVDIVVNNSGLATPSTLLEQNESDWDSVFGVNLTGAMLVAKEASKRLIKSEHTGSIINIASILGLRQGTGVSAYAASKAALIQLTKQQALEWARHGIRVNAIAPGYIETDLNREFFASDQGKALVKRIPMRRLGDQSELDGVLLLLASSAGKFMTGSVLTVDGGHLVSGL